MVYGKHVLSIVNAAYKPTYNWGYHLVGDKMRAAQLSWLDMTYEGSNLEPVGPFTQSCQIVLLPDHHRSKHPPGIPQKNSFQNPSSERVGRRA